MLINKNILFGGKDKPILELVRNIDDWVKKTFVFNFGLMSMPKRVDICQYVGIEPIEDDDIKQFQDLQLDASKYLIYMILMIGINIGIATEKKAKKKTRKKEKTV